VNRREAARSRISRFEAHLRVELIDELTRLEETTDAWDSLVAEVARPMASPFWMLAWWRNMTSGSERLRAVAVWRDSQLVAMAPYWLDSSPGGLRELRLLSAGMCYRLTVAVRRDDEAAVAPLVGRTLAASVPHPGTVRADAVDVDSPWPPALAAAWPGRRQAWLRRDRVLSAPVLATEGRSFEEWMGSKSKNFRQQMRGGRRKLEKAGAVVRMSRAATLSSDMSALIRLHHGRWAARGGSSVMSPGVERLLLEAGGELLARGQLRLWMIDAEGAPISAHLFVAAGGEVAYWNGGFDESWSQYKPALQALFAAVEHAFEHGDSRVDFGAGDQAYKRRFAEGDHPVAWYTLFPRDSAYLLNRARTLPRHLRWGAREAFERLPERHQRRIKRAAGRDAGGES
jgi:CelD/BcsL family acetyltransferase involved in cellulose biosynthesis